MELKQLIKNWTKEIAELKVEIQDYENETGKSAISAEARLQAISEILADVKQLNLPPVINCANCKHQDVSKYVEPCYGCNDYSNHQIKGGIVL